MDKIWAFPDVANYLQVSKSKLYAMVKRGDIPHIKIGKNVRILEADLIEWLEDKRRAEQRPMGFRGTYSWSLT